MARAALADPAFRDDVLAGLAAPIRAITARWLYDRPRLRAVRGDHAASRILSDPRRCRLARRPLRRGVAEIAGAGNVVVEFGAGSAAKTPILLRCIAPSAMSRSTISGDFLRDESAQRIAAEFPELAVHPVEADFMTEIPLPARIGGRGQARLLPRLDDRQHGPADGRRSPARDEGGARHGSYLLIGMVPG